MSFFNDDTSSNTSSNNEKNTSLPENRNNLNNAENLVEVGNFSQTLNDFNVMFTNANNQKKSIYVSDLQNGVSIKI